jgi:putative hydrolase of the HAD superfamily
VYSDIRHIFFDLDRTLWDFETNSREALSEIFLDWKLAEKGVGSLEAFLQAYISNNDLCWDLYRKNLISKADLRTRRFSLTLASFDLEDESLAEALGDAYVLCSPQKTALFPGAHETLVTLSQRYELHIITNGFEEVQHLKLTSTGLKKYFKHVITSEMAGSKKPDPAIFDFALKKSGAAPFQSLMIGDDPTVDVLGAIDSGMQAILFDPEAVHAKNSRFRVIKHLGELPGMLGV